jgi:hypothetical protein
MEYLGCRERVQHRGPGGRGTPDVVGLDASAPRMIGDFAR